jgi:hypothetical protein
MYATCFSLYLGRPQAWHHKNICRDKQQKSKGPLLTHCQIFIVSSCICSYVAMPEDSLKHAAYM